MGCPLEAPVSPAERNEPGCWKKSDDGIIRKHRLRANDLGQWSVTAQH